VGFAAPGSGGVAEVSTSSWALLVERGRNAVRIGASNLAGIGVCAALVSYLVLGQFVDRWHHWAAWRMVCAMCLYYWLPGWLMLGSLFPRQSFDRLESLALSFGLSHVLVVAECVTIMLAGQNLQTAWQIHGVVLLCLGACRAFRGLRPGEREASPPDQVEDPCRSGPFVTGSALVLGLTVVLLYAAGGLWKRAPTDEEVYNLVIARKFLELDRVTLSNIMFRKGMMSTYLFAPYAFMTAALVKASGLDPIIVYTNLRCFWGLISLAAFYATIKVLTGRRDAAAISLLVGCMLAMSNAAGQFAEREGAVFWGQLTPMSHHADFALGVLLPVMLLFMVNAYRCEGGTMKWVLITPLVILACVVTHAREGVQALLYGAFLSLATLVLSPREWRRVLPVAAIACMTVVLGKTFQHFHHDLNPYLVLHENANRVMIENLFAKMYHEFPPHGFFARWYFNSDAGLFRPYFMLAFIFAPGLVLVRDRHGWARALWGTLVGFMLLYRIPPLTLALIRGTYSEMLWTPARYVSTTSFLLIGVIAFTMLPVLDRLAARLMGPGDGLMNRRCLSFLVVMALGGCLFGAAVKVAAHLTNQHHRTMDAMYVWLAVASLAALWIRWKRPERLLDEDRLWPSSLRFPDPVIVGLVVFLLPQVWLQSAGRNLFVRGLDMRLPNWYASGAEFYTVNYGDKQPPRSMMEFIRGRIPEESVVAYPPECELVPLVYVNQYSVSPGLQHYLADIGFVDRYSELMGRRLPEGKDLFETYQLRSNLYAEILCKEQPFFSADESSEVLNRLIDGFHVDFLLATDPAVKRVERLRLESGRPVKRVHGVGGWSLIAFPE
jgi:hypothetical protein